MKLQKHFVTCAFVHFQLIKSLPLINFFPPVRRLTKILHMTLLRPLCQISHCGPPQSNAVDDTDADFSLLPSERSHRRGDHQPPSAANISDASRLSAVRRPLRPLTFPKAHVASAPPTRAFVLHQTSTPPSLPPPPTLPVPAESHFRRGVSGLMLNVAEGRRSLTFNIT